MSAIRSTKPTDSWPVLGHLELAINKKDFDLSVQLFELTARGEYFQLPPFQNACELSYARDLSTRTSGSLATGDARLHRDPAGERQVARGSSRIVAR